MHFSWETYLRFRDLTKMYGKWLVQGMQKTVEESALKSPSGIDTRSFLWTFDRLDKDHELELFFSGLPGFCSSKVVNDPLPSLAEEGKQKLFEALIGLLGRTFLSDLFPRSDQNRRATICAKAIAPAEIPDSYLWIFNRIIYGDQYEGLCTAELGCILRGWANGLGGDQQAAMVVQATPNGIIPKAQRHNDSWFDLASNGLGISEIVLRDYASHGDSLSLAILTHVTHQQFFYHREASHWPTGEFLEVLLAASKFNVEDTLPELRHKFCALWNQIVHDVQNQNDWHLAIHALRRIRNIYMALHQDADSAPTRFSPSTGDQDDIL